MTTKASIFLDNQPENFKQQHPGHHIQRDINMDVESIIRINDDWLSEPFLDLGGSEGAEFLFPNSGSDSDRLHSPIFTDVSDSTSESGLVLVRKRKAESEKSGSSRNGSTEKSNSREHSQESESHEEEVVQKSRKGHKKSRQGCFNCKKRKIKVCLSPLALE